MINNVVTMKHILFTGLLLIVALSSNGIERGKLDSEYSTKNAKIKFLTYQNGAAEYVIDVPMEILYPQGESGNNMGQIFKSAEMDAQLFTYGKGNPDNQTIDELFFDSLNPENKNELVFTYKIMKDNWFVVTGFHNEKIFYKKVILGKTDGLIKSMYFECPKSKKNIYENIIIRMSKSFKEM